MGTMSRILAICKWLGVGLLAVAFLFVLVLAARIVLYRQTDDRERVASKQEYLEHIADLTGGTPPGPNVVVVLFDDLGLGDPASSVATHWILCKPSENNDVSISK